MIEQLKQIHHHLQKCFLQIIHMSYHALLCRARELNKLRGTFLQGLLKHNTNGRIHAHINQIRSDSGGTVSGRFSYNHPNLQQIPSRGQFATRN
jgi:DNA polymerase I-like protein with 3'-5' exonuclease and polymerase domains